ncbi:MAG: sulfotransferase domain-containing protein [Brevefilum sp.]|nr:sulfotransferase domain-containing protein [Brevefilum sp.]
MTGKLPHKIILSAGMPRAGSAWFYHLTRDLWIAAGGDNIWEIRKTYPLKTVITETNQNIDNFTLRKTLLILLPFLLGKSFTIKIHFAPMPLGRSLIRLKWIRPTFIYRDPRDALLSAYEYGRRVEKTGRPNAFSHLDTFEKSIDFMSDYMTDWETWMRLADPAIFRYEDLLTDYYRQAERLVNFLDLDLQSQNIRKAIEKNKPRDAAQKEGGHFSKGKIGRFRDVLTPEQIALCEERFAPYLEKMGYEL